jgi:hypothetical protein
MLCQVPWDAVQGGDLDPSDPEAANPGLCLQTLITQNSYQIDGWFVDVTLNTGLIIPIPMPIMKLILFNTY